MAEFQNELTGPVSSFYDAGKVISEIILNQLETKRTYRMHKAYPARLGRK